MAGMARESHEESEDSRTFLHETSGVAVPLKTPPKTERVYTEVIIPLPLWFLVDLIIGYIF